LGARSGYFTFDLAKAAFPQVPRSGFRPPDGRN
jgi:hypothetical protein